MSVQSISPYRSSNVRLQKILSISMAFEGKLGGLDLMALSDAELDTMYGYAEEHLKRVADIRKNGLKETKEYSKEEVAKMNKHQFLDFQKQQFMKEQEKK